MYCMYSNKKQNRVTWLIIIFFYYYYCMGAPEGGRGTERGRGAGGGGFLIYSNAKKFIINLKCIT